MSECSPASAFVKIEPEEEICHHAFELEVTVERIKSEAEQQLYADHDIKEDMVIGPTEICRLFPEPELANTTNSIHCKLELVDARNELHCGLCGKWCLTAVELQIHMQTHNEEASETDLIQTKRTADHYTSPHGQYTRNEPGQYPCGQCSKGFKLKSNLVKHQGVHGAIEQNSVSIPEVTQSESEKNISKKTDLTIRNGPERYSCDICDKVYTQKHWLQKHIINHNRFYTCDICARKFTFKRSLKRHAFVHIALNAFECDICIEKFNHKSSLNTHMKVHSRPKSFKCNICKKKLSCKSSLDRHMMVHSGIKPFECDICLKTFSEKNKLNIHKRIHNEIKGFECDICMKKFSQRNHLNEHMLVHR